MKNLIKRTTVATLLMATVSLTPTSQTVPSAEAGLLVAGVSIVGELTSAFESDDDRATVFGVVSALGGISFIGGAILLFTGNTGWGLGLMALPAQADHGLSGLQKQMPYLALAEAQNVLTATQDKVANGQFETVKLTAGTDSLRDSQEAGVVRFTEEEVGKLLDSGSYTEDQLNATFSVLK